MLSPHPRADRVVGSARSARKTASSAAARAQHANSVVDSGARTRAAMPARARPTTLGTANSVETATAKPFYNSKEYYQGILHNASQII